MPRQHTENKDNIINNKKHEEMKKDFLSKVFGIALIAVLAMTMGSCRGCSGSGSGQAPYHDYDGDGTRFSAGVSHIQALHRQTMHALAKGKKYEWRNSRVLLSDSIKAGNLDSIRVVEVRDVFQYFAPGPLVQVISSNIEEGTIVPWPVHDVWIEDRDMSDLPIDMSAEDAIRRLGEWNGIIPPASFISLRCPVGPKECNAQWVVGDEYNVIFIDAVTGEISDSNPAFRE